MTKSVTSISWQHQFYVNSTLICLLELRSGNNIRIKTQSWALPVILLGPRINLLACLPVCLLCMMYNTHISHQCTCLSLFLSTGSVCSLLSHLLIYIHIPTNSTQLQVAHCRHIIPSVLFSIMPSSSSNSSRSYIVSSQNPFDDPHSSSSSVLDDRLNRSYFSVPVC